MELKYLSILLLKIILDYFDKPVHQCGPMSGYQGDHMRL
jgi:hypothetical protein